MSKVTRQKLIDRAKSAIENRESFVYDIAIENGQILDNVKHMRWFIKEVANYLIDNTKKWSHFRQM